MTLSDVFGDDCLKWEESFVAFHCLKNNNNTTCLKTQKKACCFLRRKTENNVFCIARTMHKIAGNEDCNSQTLKRWCFECGLGKHNKKGHTGMQSCVNQSCGDHRQDRGLRLIIVVLWKQQQNQIMMKPPNLLASTFEHCMFHNLPLCLLVFAFHSTFLKTENFKTMFYGKQSFHLCCGEWEMCWQVNSKIGKQQNWLAGDTLNCQRT